MRLHSYRKRMGLAAGRSGDGPFSYGVGELSGRSFLAPLDRCCENDAREFEGAV